MTPRKKATLPLLLVSAAMLIVSGCAMPAQEASELESRVTVAEESATAAQTAAEAAAQSAAEAAEAAEAAAASASAAAEKADQIFRAAQRK